MSNIIVRLSFNKQNGTCKSEIVSHENGSSCQDSDNDDILKSILNSDVEGFGPIASIKDEGHTCDYFETENKFGKLYKPTVPSADNSEKSTDKKSYLL